MTLGTIFLRVFRSPRGGFALVVLALLLTTSLVSYAWLPYDPNAANALNAWLPPSFEHWLGTDASGRDLASRLMAGSRITVLVALGAAIIAGTIGLALAVVAALGPRWIREPLIVTIDVLIAFPTLLLAIMFAAAFGSGIPVVIAAIGIGFGVSIGRVVRAELRQVASEDYVLAARAAGLSRTAIFRTHLLPGIAPVFTVQLSFSMGLAILAEAGLSYLGIGIPPSVPSWGRMLAETQAHLSQHPLVVMWPGLAITLVVLAFTLLGDALREAIDPRLDLPQDTEPGAPETSPPAASTRTHPDRLGTATGLIPGWSGQRPDTTQNRRGTS